MVQIPGPTPGRVPGPGGAWHDRGPGPKCPVRIIGINRQGRVPFYSDHVVPVTHSRWAARATFRVTANPRFKFKFPRAGHSGWQLEEPATETRTVTHERVQESPLAQQIGILEYCGFEG
jgi:hypothetical protein